MIPKDAFKSALFYKGYRKGACPVRNSTLCDARGGEMECSEHETARIIDRGIKLLGNCPFCIERLKESEMGRWAFAEFLETKEKKKPTRK